jgi:uncharacterized protein
MAIPTDDALITILREARAIALTIHSPKPDRPSYQIAQFLRSIGYRVYPIHPALAEIDGHRVYPSLADLPGPVDIVNVFRRSEFLPSIVEEAIAIPAPTVWAQLGVVYPEAEAIAQPASFGIATAAGINLIMDRCIKLEYLRLMG